MEGRGGRGERPLPSHCGPVDGGTSVWKAPADVISTCSLRETPERVAVENGVFVVNEPWLE